MTITLTREEALKMALETLEEVQMAITTSQWMNKRVDALRAALAQPEHEHRDVVIKGDLWRIEFLPDHAASVVLVRANYEAQPEPEPVAWIYEFGTDNCDAVNEIRWYKNVSLTKPTGLVRNVTPLYTASPQREWQWLTDEEIEADIWDILIKRAAVTNPVKDFAEVIQAKSKEKNT